MEMRTTRELEEGVHEIRQAPHDRGPLTHLFIRPATDERVGLNEVRLSVEGGVEGDGWAVSKGVDSRSQVALMNTRVLRLLAGNDERMALAGDNLIVDLDLSDENLQPGQRLRVGEAELELTDMPHTGCKKFMARYGKDAVLFVNSAEGKALQLRGRYARVVVEGTVRVDDTVEKL